MCCWQHWGARSSLASCCLTALCVYVLLRHGTSELMKATEGLRSLCSGHVVHLRMLTRERIKSLTRQSHASKEGSSAGRLNSPFARRPFVPKSKSLGGGGADKAHGGEVTKPGDGELGLLVPVGLTSAREQPWVCRVRGRKKEQGC